MTGITDRRGDLGLEARLAGLEERIAKSMDRASDLAAKQEARLADMQAFIVGLRLKGRP